MKTRYRGVKDQFEVVPKRDLLYKEGFLKPPEDNLALQQQGDVEMQQNIYEREHAGDETAEAAPPDAEDEQQHHHHHHADVSAAAKTETAADAADNRAAPEA